MKKLVFLFLFSYLNFHLLATDKDLLIVRSLYYKASADSEGAENFYNYLLGKPQIAGSLHSGYKGISCMIKANYLWSPYSKLSFFNKGKNLLDNAIENDLSNVELRFLRYCAQSNAPSFLGYNGKIQNDKLFILSNYSLIKDLDLKDRIKAFLNSSKYITETEKQSLK